MKDCFLAVFVVMLVALPSGASAGDFRNPGRHAVRHQRIHHVQRHPHHRHNHFVHKNCRHRADEMFLGVMGGVLGAVILDHVFTSPVIVRHPPVDPYAVGYATGYEYGRQHQQQRRYDEGYRRGYEEGVYPLEGPYD